MLECTPQGEQDNLACNMRGGENGQYTPEDGGIMRCKRDTIKKIRQETGRGNNNPSFYCDKNIFYLCKDK